MTPQEMRDANLAYLNRHGFKPATWMPLPVPVGTVSEEVGFAGGTLRPVTEIATRFLALGGLFAWAAAPSNFEAVVADFLGRNELRTALTEALSADRFTVIAAEIDREGYDGTI